MKYNQIIGGDGDFRDSIKTVQYDIVAMIANESSNKGKNDDRENTSKKRNR